MTRAERSKAKAGYWRPLVEEQARSGERDAEFCRERGIGVHSLRAWRYRFAREVAARRVRRKFRRPRRVPATVDFVPVSVRRMETPDVTLPTPSPSSGSPSGVEVVLARDRVLRIERGFDEETLLRVVALFERR